MGEGGERELGPIPSPKCPAGDWSLSPISALEMGEGWRGGLGGREGHGNFILNKTIYTQGS